MKKITLSICSCFLAAASFSQTTVSFNYTGSVQTFVIPACVDTVTIAAGGAQGGGTNGGFGGSVQCRMPVSPGDVLNIYVGGQGGPLITNSPGGYNGGGTAGTCTVMYPGGGGGGASDVRLNGITLADRIVVAGGGGGGHDVNGPGGIGGGLIGGNVLNNGNTCMATWATGGSQVAGGNPSTWSGTCCSFTPVPGGSLGIGGNGCGPGINCNNGDAGAGGGGGYYGGGGGGTYTGGGGGSSYTSPNAVSVVHTMGDHSSDGNVSIIYSPCVGTDDISALNTTRIFPNPAKGILNINLPGGLSDVSLMIYDVQGRTVYVGSKINKTSIETEQIDISALSDGVYYVKISSGKSTVHQKLVVSK